MKKFLLISLCLPCIWTK